MSLDLSKIGKRSEPIEFEWGWKDAVTYALGVGAQEDELDYLIETAGPKVLPTFAVVPALPANFTVLSTIGGNLLTVLHGAQKIVVHRAIPAHAKVRTTGEITGIYDKGKNALVVVKTATEDASGPLFDTIWQIVYRGEGGFAPDAKDRGPEPPAAEPPAREPDFRHEQATAPTQALLYRLSGDVNPVHANPQVAQMVGFPRTILHGLCTYGFAARAVIRHACGGDGNRLKTFGARFSKIVFPGDTLVTEGWLDFPTGPNGVRSGGSPNRVILRTSTKERLEPVLTHAVAEIG